METWSNKYFIFMKKVFLSFGLILALGLTSVVFNSCGDDDNSIPPPSVIPVTSISLSEAGLGLRIGSTFVLEATVKPDDATDKKVTWTSSKTSVARVNSNGEVTTVAIGEAVITATAGGKSATCKISVSEAPASSVAVTSITLDKTTLTLGGGQVQKLEATVKPDNATNKTVTWTSSNASIARVNTNSSRWRNDHYRDSRREKYHLYSCCCTNFIAGKNTVRKNRLYIFSSRKI